MGIIRYDDIEQQIRAHNRAIIRQEGMVEEAAGLALQDLLERMSNSAGRALTASSLPVSFGTGELFTLGQVRGWWADAVDEHLTSSLLESWNAGYRATSDGVMLQGSFDSAGGYVANVADRLSVTQTPLIPDQAFNIVRESLLDEMSRGSTTDAISKRIASDLNWVGPDRADLERRLSVVNQQLEDVLDGYGPPGSSARNTARLNDPQVRSLQKRNSGIVRQLDRDESVWRTRARTISRTETTGAWNAGALDAAQREGQAVKVWIALADEFVRDSHLDAAGQCVPVDGEFQVGGSNMDAPGVGGPADEVINCRCSMLFADSCEMGARMVAPAQAVWDQDRADRRIFTNPDESPFSDNFVPEVTDSLGLHSQMRDGRRVIDAGRFRQYHAPYYRNATRGAVKVAEPEFRVLGGETASGKSTVLESGQLRVPRNAVTADADKAKDVLPEYKLGLRQGREKAASFVHEESSLMAKNLTADSLQRGFNTILDGTGNGSVDSLARKIALARENGARRVVGDYATVDTEVAINRAILRGQQQGRYVPTKVIRETHEAVSATFPRVVAADLFDEVRLWDTNGAVPRVIYQKIGGVEEIFDRDAYIRFLNKARPEDRFVLP